MSSKMNEIQSSQLEKYFESGEMKLLGAVTYSYGVVSFRAYTEKSADPIVYPMSILENGAYSCAQPFYTVSTYHRLNK